MEENETQEVETEEVEDTIEEVESETKKTTEEKPKAKPKRTPEEELAYFEGRVKRLQKDLGKSVESRKEEAKTQPGELDDTALDYLDLKGVSEHEDIEVVRKIVAKTGLSVRDALKDDYVQTKLAANKATRDVHAATPSSTKRGSGLQGVNIEAALTRAEKEGVLPEDRDTREKVIEALMKKGDPSKPAYLTRL